MPWILLLMSRAFRIPFHKRATINLLLLKQPITHYRVTIYWSNFMRSILLLLCAYSWSLAGCPQSLCTILLPGNSLRLLSVDSLLPLCQRLTLCAVTLVRSPDPQATLCTLSPTSDTNHIYQRSFLLNSQPFNINV
jgi:hypothetical protein